MAGDPEVAARIIDRTTREIEILSAAGVGRGLRDRGLSTSGTLVELRRRLAAAYAAEEVAKIASAPVTPIGGDTSPAAPEGDASPPSREPPTDDEHEFGDPPLDEDEGNAEDADATVGDETDERAKAEAARIADERAAVADGSGGREF